MTFPTLSFAAFGCILLLLLAVFQGHSARNVIYLLGSYVFYMWWHPAFILLIVFSTGVDYVVGHRIHGAGTPATRKAWLWVSVLCNLGILAVFKYANFFQENLGTHEPNRGDWTRRPNRHGRAHR